jgi:hypothetical protein
MSKFTRFVVALALTVAVPVQAMSAVMAGICMASGHHSGAPVQADAHDNHPHDHGDQDAGANLHGHDGGDGQVSDSHCPPCVACCASASISSAASTFLPEPPATGQFASSSSFAAGFQPDGVYRPPLAL